MMETPISTPAFNSVKVRPGNARADARPTNSAAAAKRRPTKNIGPLTVMTLCTSRKVPPHSMVMNISTISALLRRKETAVCKLLVGRLMVLRTRRERRTIAAKWAVYCANPYQ